MNAAFPRVLIFFSLLALVPLLGACGGAAGAAAEPATPEGQPPLPDPIDAPAGDPLLEAQLRQVIGRVNLVAPPTPPARDAALVALGRALFFDKILSGNRNIACATCHHPSSASGDALSVSIGAGGVGLGAARQPGTGALIPRNAPPLFNRGLPGVNQMFWDSRVNRIGAPGGPPPILQTPEPALNGPNPPAREIAEQLDTALAAQALFPLLAEAEMRGAIGSNEIAAAETNLSAWELLMARLVGTENGTVGGIAAYRNMFQSAFPEVADLDALNIGHLGRALGAYEQSAFLAMDSPFDAWLTGEGIALSDPEKRGALLFYGRADCARCHAGPLLTDNRHHAIAIPQVGPGRDFPGEDLGREAVTGDRDNRYEFRTPSLRNVALTGPWMHDGAYTTLESAIAHYDNPVGNLLSYDATQLSPLLRGSVDRDPARNQDRADALSDLLRPAPRLNPADVQSLAAFLRALTDPGSVDLSAEVPLDVPSGLPVDRAGPDDE